MFERFVKGARRVVETAQLEAQRLGAPEVGPEHLVLAIIAGDAGPASRALANNDVTGAAFEAGMRATIAFQSGRSVLTRADAAAMSAIGIDLDEVRLRFEESFGPAGGTPAPSGGPGVSLRHIRFSPGCKRALEASLTEAKRLRHDRIGPEHILLGVLAAERSFAAEALGVLGATPAGLRDQLLNELKKAS